MTVFEEHRFLRAIAEHPGDDLPRMVYADWLEEAGETARAESIRVQCELAQPDLAEDRRGALRARECALLDAHRDNWILAIDLPVDGVRFARGLISELQLLDWDGGKLLDPEITSLIAAVEVLDLSNLQIGDAGIEAFARRAEFPALRKLLLNGNALTDAGAIALASAKGLPRLAAVYLFDNSVGERGRWALREAPHFTPTELDLGEPATGYAFSPGQADAARREFVRKHLTPLASQYVRKYEHLRSAHFCVAQYWADEADDAVHAYLIVSELAEPTLVGAQSGGDEKSESDPNVPNTRIKQEFGDGGSAVDMYGTGIPWDDNGGAIPLWAAFAPEGGSQEHEDLSEAYSPAVMFHRHGGYEILPMIRPHLDGILPEWEAD